MAESAPGPPHEWLQHLYSAGQWERLDKVALDCLAADPEDSDAHEYRAWALLKMDRLREMEPHVTFLLDRDPENLSTLELAACWHIASTRPRKALPYLQTALELDPEAGRLWFLAASAEAQLGHVKKSQEYSSRARQLDPDNPDIARLHISLGSIEKTDARSALADIWEYERALALDPESDSLLASIADVYLDELEMPERAEEYYRRALQIDPMDKDHQQGLWRAIQKQNIWFRTLRLPVSGIELVANVFRGMMIKPSLIFYFIIGIKFVLCFFVWLALAFVVFAPACWCVEWLVMADIQRAHGMADKLGGWWLRFHQQPFWVRLSVCITLNLALWWGMFYAVGVSPLHGFLFIAGFFALNFIMLAAKIASRRSEVKAQTRKASSPPPLPKMSQPPPLPSMPGQSES
ncbi:tetratricopeptide repeat protein [Brevifollis gellanilyticus]|uniref:Uncharacterized protein n=1 Tax=Brevifollis gellanilyticus TaxID=748831 RepID=A0A512MDZ5_9BACT|nr:tetratricopeptide repeat protein [Brevifollis gellanilyticus]GEP44959.1 hypothetical protein BGE01nite_42500 [Brevifollis gellanilyticus]